MASIAVEVSATANKVYSWRDADGVLVFSDTPKLGAKEIKIEEAALFTSTINSAVLNLKSKGSNQKYQINITQPANHSTFRDNNGLVEVEGTMNLPFNHKHEIILSLDGKISQKSHSSTSFTLRNIERGEHTIKMDLINEKGKVIASSSPITFYMHRSSVIKAN